MNSQRNNNITSSKSTELMNCLVGDPLTQASIQMARCPPESVARTRELFRELKNNLLSRWNIQFSTVEDLVEALAYWSEQLQTVDDRAFFQAKDNFFNSGVKDAPSCSVFKKLCLEEMEKHKLVAPLYVSEPEPKAPDEQKKSAIKKDIEIAKKAVSDIANVIIKSPAKTTAEIEENKQRQLALLDAMGVKLPSKKLGDSNE